MSTTVPVPATRAGPVLTPHRGWIPWAVAGVLGACLVALAAWVLLGLYTGAERDATSLVDDVTAAWSSGDGAKTASYYTPDATLTTGDGTIYSGTAEIARLVATVNAQGDFTTQPFTVQRESDVAVMGENAVWFGQWRTVESSAPVTEVVVMQLANGKIAKQWNLELGYTPPFTNATP
jgi:uncharacterized protein (TIGR02246 family)